MSEAGKPNSGKSIARTDASRAETGPHTGAFASPPCFMHELSAEFASISVDRQQALDVARWRKSERERLIATRLALPVEERVRHSERVALDLDGLLPSAPDAVVSVYWPFRGEPDLKPWMTAVSERGIGIALPVVVGKGRPLVFHAWKPGCKLAPGVWNIPYPVDGAVVTPTVVIAPLVGFDAQGYRLGYGGGYFDRTLAALSPRPFTIGIGFESARLPTIFPQLHDIPLDAILTEAGERTQPDPQTDPETAQSTP